MGNVLSNIRHNIESVLHTNSESSDHDQSNSTKICIGNKKTYDPEAINYKESQYLENWFKKIKIKYYFARVYYCSQCQIALRNKLSVICHYMLHLHREHSLDSDDIIQFNFKEEYVIINCILCKKTMYSDEELVKHLIFEEHRKIVKHLSYINIKNDFDLSNNYTCKSLGNEISEISNQFQLTNISDRMFCVLCKTVIQNSDINVHIHKTEHCEELRRHKELILSDPKTYKSKRPVELIKRESAQSCSTFYMCFICNNKSFDNLLQLSAHSNEENHKYKIRVLHMILNTGTGNIREKTCYCNMCLLNINTDSIMQHLPVPDVPLKLIFSNELNRLIKNQNPKIPEGNDHTKAIDSALNNFQILNENCMVYRDKYYHCDICKRKMTDIKAVSLHIAKKSHKNKLVIVNSKTIEKLSHSASLTNIQLSFDSTLAEEYLIEKHTFKNSKSLKFCKSNLTLSNDALDELIDFELDERYMKISDISENSQLSKTTIDNNSKCCFNKKYRSHFNDFIELCIKPGCNNIYSINAEEVCLLQLGTKLTLPFQSDKRICIPCHSHFFNYYLYDHLHCKYHIDNLYKMVNIHTQTILSNINFDKFYMVKISNDRYFCYACGFDTFIFDVANHVKSEYHILKSKFCKSNSELLFNEIIGISQNLWYYAQVFVCDICKHRFEYELDFIVHLKSQKHINKCNQLTDTILKFGVCPVCVTCWYGDSDAYSKHCLNDFHKQFFTHNEFMVLNMPMIAVEALSEPNAIVTFLINESNKTINQQQDKELELLQAIEISVESVYPKAKAYMFGSRLSHLGCLDSDVDVFLDCENVHYNTGSKGQGENYLRSVINLFENQQEYWIIEEISLDSRVPMIKLRHIHTNLKCDVSFSNRLSVEKSKLIKYFNIAFPICRQMILYLKKWLSFCRLSGSDGITTYAISWFVIFYLQIKGILPSVHRLLEINNESTIVDGWECVPDAISVAIPVADTDFKFEDLLIGFFLYYGVFDHCSNVICPFLGKIITKYNFANTNTLPEEMKIYKHRVTKDEVEIFRFDSPMCIQDPVDHSQNITPAVSKFQLRSFRKYCTDSAKIIIHEKMKIFE